MAGLLVYALHSLTLLLLFRRHGAASLAAERLEAAAPLPAGGNLPQVLVQVPLYNERDVAERAIRTAAALNWPGDRLTIQVLDDSTDDTTDIAARVCADLANRGVAIEHRHRTLRSGFKAGALQAGLEASDAEYVALFDADFVPRPDFLTRAIRPLLADGRLAVVQGRWDHLNARQNAVTRAQAIGLDSHFAIEQAARAWSGLPMHFNGTCGLWRRRAIDDAGGWSAETLTEDIDLSYRAQLAGYRCTYRMDLAVPGELPADIDAWRSQQFRWAKGSIQVARKLLGPIWRTAWPLTHKLAATAHLTHYGVNLLVLLSLIAAPPVLWLTEARPWPVLLLAAAAIVGGLAASLSVYVHSQRFLRGARAGRLIRDLPVLVSLGTGLALSNGRGVAEALFRIASPFVRTPKTGGGQGSYRAGRRTGLPECAAALWALWGHLGGIGVMSPLLLLYVSGFAWVGILSLKSRVG